MSTVRVKSVGQGLLAAILGGTAFVAIVLSIPIAAILLSPGGLRGAAAFLMVTAPFVLLFVGAASVVLWLLRLSLRPERDYAAVAASRYRFEIAAACVGALALPTLVFVSAEQNPWAFGSLPIGAIAGWIAGMVQKRNLHLESRESRPLAVPENQ